jgi:apolipoprotein N-acyltransferase
VLTSLATATNVPLLIGAPGLVPSITATGHDIRQNLTLLYLPVTGQAEDSYAKIHLVPFGEYIAFRDVPLLGSIVRYFTPIDFDYSLTPGDKWTRFTLKTQNAGTKTFTFATPICFEDTMPTPTRLMTLSPDGKKTDFLLNVSNDGWFFSTELDQHLQACQLRAVENRIPIARSVNTGDSGFIDSDGRIVQLVTNPQTNSSIGAIGTASQTLSIDSRISLYSQIGDLLPIVTTTLTTLLLAYTYARPRRNA